VRDLNVIAGSLAGAQRNEHVRPLDAGDLPAQSPEKFELVDNLKKAKALGLSVRESFLLLADQVIDDGSR